MPVQFRTPAPPTTGAPDAFIGEPPADNELVINAVTGRVRQAGAVQDEGPWVVQFRQRCERDLYVFTKAILKRAYLTPALHGKGARWLQRRPPYRKLMLWPRKHAKCFSASYWERVRHRLMLSVTKDGSIYRDHYKQEEGCPQVIYRITTRQGRMVDVTSNHPFLRWGNVWQSLDEGLHPGHWIAIVRQGLFGEKQATPAEIALAEVTGWMLGDANLQRQVVSIHQKARRVRFLTLLHQAGFFGTVRQPAQRCASVNIRGMRPLWRSWGLLDKLAATKFVPAWVLQANEVVIRAFLRGLFTADATLTGGRDKGTVVKYTTVSFRLADDVHHLLAKFGVHVTTFKRPYVWRGRAGLAYTVTFTDTVGIFRSAVPQRFSPWVDRLPPEWRRSLRPGDVRRCRTFGLRIDNAYATQRWKVRKVAQLLNLPDLMRACDNDLAWDQIRSVECLGVQPIVSIESQEHTLAVGDIITHNTSLCSHGLPCHILIQPKESNVYLPGWEGADTRVLLAGETSTLAEKNLRVISGVFESNKLFRALWPHRCWDNARRDSKKWNEKEIIIPRPTEFGDPSIRTIGVDGAITGSRCDVAIKDDLVSIAAANSVVEMRTAIAWHINSRALYESDDIPEFIIGTRWAVGDIYEYILSNDPSVEAWVRSIVEDDLPIYPEKFTLSEQGELGKTSIPSLKKEFGALFWLLYMNSVANPELTDFDAAALRDFTVKDGKILFEEDERDLALKERETPKPDAHALRGVVLNRAMKDALFGEGGRMGYLRFKAR